MCPHVLKMLIPSANTLHLSTGYSNNYRNPYYRRHKDIVEYYKFQRYQKYIRHKNEHFQSRKCQRQLATIS